MMIDRTISFTISKRLPLS